MSFPNTGSSINRGLDDPAEGRTSTSLSSQIVVKVNNVAVGALQSLEINQTRPLARINEIGTDGNVEIVPQGSTTFDLTANRIVFDQLRLPEAFSRGFRFINAQRIPFDIEIFDINDADVENVSASNNNGIVVMKFVNCWFQNYRTPYNAGDYLITESATIYAETGLVHSPSDFASGDSSLRITDPQSDTAGIENSTNLGNRRGAVDASGLVNAVFGS